VIAHWLHRRRRALRLELSEFEPASEWWPGLNDLCATFELDGKQFSGRAQDTDRALALEKACAEAVERAAYALDAERARVTMTSSGYAAHRDRRLACAGARRELIERDVLMCNVLTDAPLRPLTRPAPRDGSFTSLRERLRSAHVELHVAELRSDFQEHVVICAAFGHEHRPAFGVVLGCGISRILRRAIDKAVQECLMMMLGLLCGRKAEPHTKAAFMRLETFDFGSHWRLGMDRHVGLAYRAKLAALASSPAPRRVARPYSRGFTYRQIDLPAALASCPVVVVRAEHPLLQPVLVGPPQRAQLRKARLAHFLRNIRIRGLRCSDRRIHILG
jgi:ribosomal protein S12 methylthiotransferase accessory factor YcaO